MKTTLLKKARLRFLRDTAAVAVPGAYVELGVWRGGSAASFIAGLTDVRDCWLFDSFEGMPAPGEFDSTPKKHASKYKHYGMPDDDSETLAICKSVMAKMDYPQDRIHIVKGWFDSTVPATIVDIGDIAVLHVDCDWYESVALSLAAFYDKVVPHGVVIIDDYGCWLGARKAVDEFMVARAITEKLEVIDGTGRYIVKGSRA